jgi:hypothetical protein
MNPPLKNPLDASKFREQYLSSLRLMASNNQRNYNANQIYAQTGQTPNVIPDTRTSTEKMADIEGLRVAVRSKMREITDPQNANKVAMTLNVGELSFVLNAWITIRDDMKRKFALGVPADIFITYLRKLMDKYAQVDFVDFGLQQTTGEGILLSNQQILGQMVDLPALNSLREQLRTLQLSNSLGLATLRQTILTELERIETIIPSAEDLKKIAETQSLEDRADIQQYLNQALADVPTKRDLEMSQAQLYNAQQNNNAEQMEQVLAKIAGIVSTTKGEITPIKKVRETVRKTPQKAEAGTDTNEVYLRPDDFDALNKAGKFRFLKGRRDAGQIQESVNTKQNLAELKRIYTLWWSNYEDKEEEIMNAPMEYQEQGEQSMGEFSNPSVAGRFTGRRQPEEKGKGLRGRGLRGRKATPFADKLKQEYIEPKKVYTQLGKYYINEDRLNNDSVIMLRSNKGLGTGFNSTRISTKLSKIIKKLIKQITPDFEEIQDLTDEDKETLHRLLKITKLSGSGIALDPITGKDKKELEQFDILKGQILAGNNNPKLIKEFKGKLLGYMEAGRIPKRQCVEILQELMGRGLL